MTRRPSGRLVSLLRGGSVHSASMTFDLRHGWATVAVVALTGASAALLVSASHRASARAPSSSQSPSVSTKSQSAAASEQTTDQRDTRPTEHSCDSTTGTNPQSLHPCEHGTMYTYWLRQTIRDSLLCILELWHRIDEYIRSTAADEDGAMYATAMRNCAGIQRLTHRMRPWALDCHASGAAINTQIHKMES